MGDASVEPDGTSGTAGVNVADGLVRLGLVPGERTARALLVRDERAARGPHPALVAWLGDLQFDDDGVARGEALCGPNRLLHR